MAAPRSREKVSRDSNTLGSLITRHIAEFDRTVKTYGGELVERLGQRTQDVSEAMRNYVDTFDQRVTSRASELTGAIDTRLSQFEQQPRTRASPTSPPRLPSSGKEVVEALDSRIGAVTEHHQRRAAPKSPTRSAPRSARSTRPWAPARSKSPTTLDSRIGRFEDLLVGRAETVTNQIETRTKAAADALNARMEQLGQSIKTNAAEAERSLGQLATLHHRRDAHQRQRSRTHAARRQRRGCPQLRRQGRRDRQHRSASAPTK